MKTCQCKKYDENENLSGRYVNSEKAIVHAYNSEKAYFIGISCNKWLILCEILDRDSKFEKNIIGELEHNGISIDGGLPPLDLIKKQGKKDRINYFKFYLKYISLCCPANLSQKELQSAVKVTKEWNKYNKLVRDFLAIKDNDSWEKWMKENLVNKYPQKQWISRWCEFLRTTGYSIGTVSSLENDEWPKEWKKRWEFCDSVYY